MIQKKRVRIVIGKETDKYLNGVIANLKALGLKNVQKPDAIRYIIKMNETVNLKARRKRRSNEVYFE